MPANADELRSFRKAKKLLAKTVYIDNLYTFYCQVPYKNKKILLPHENYVIQKDKKRANRLEWEHVVPAHAFGQSFSEWRTGHKRCKKKNGRPFKGRKCASKINKEFQIMQADLYNLVPSIGELNGLRSNYSFAALQEKDLRFGKCEFFIKKNRVEPPDYVKGGIARIYMYMETNYPGRGVLAKKNRLLFEAWSKMDPVDKRECEIYLRKKKIVKNENPILQKLCSASVWSEPKQDDTPHEFSNRPRRVLK